MWPLLQIKKLTEHSLLALISGIVCVVHCAILCMCAWYIQKHSLQRFVLNAPKVYGTIVLMPMQKKVDRPQKSGGTPGQARKIIHYDAYKKMQKKKSKDSGTKAPALKQNKKSGAVAGQVISQTVSSKKAKKIEPTSPTMLVSSAKRTAPAKKLTKNPKIESVAVSFSLKSHKVTQPIESVEVALTMPVQSVKQEVISEVIAPVAPPVAPEPVQTGMQKSTASSLIDEKELTGTQELGGGGAEGEDLGEPTLMGREEIESLQLQDAITDAIQKVWFPPLGLSRSCAGAVQVTTDKHGCVTQVSTVTKSTSVAYDIAARNAMHSAVFEDKRLHNITFIVELGDDEQI